MIVGFGYLSSLLPDEAHNRALADEFAQAHPGLAVEFVPLDQAAYRPYSDGTREIDYDVLHIQPFSMGAAQERGRFLALDDLIQADRDFPLEGFYPAALDLFRTDGSTWAIPYQVDFSVMYYNQDLFDRYDVPYPQNGWIWQDFLETALAFPGDEEGVFGYALFNAPLDVRNFARQHGAEGFDDCQEPADPAAAGAMTLEAVRWVTDLIFTHNVAPTPAQALKHFGGSDSRWVAQAIAEGKAAMWVESFAGQGGRYWPMRWKMNWGMVALPRGEQASSEALPDGLAISSSSKDPQAAWKWVAFLSQKIPYRGVPALSSLAGSETFVSHVGQEQAAVVAATLEGVLHYYPGGVPEPACSRKVQAFWSAVQECLDGRATPDEALAQVQSGA